MRVKDENSINDVKCKQDNKICFPNGVYLVQYDEKWQII